MDCGPTCLRMIAKYHGKSFSQESLKRLANISREGVSLLDIADAAENLGFDTITVKIPLLKLKHDAILPCISFINQKHFSVIYKISDKYIYAADPAIGYIKYTFEEFEKIWLEANSSEGIILMLQPTEKFFKQVEEGTSDKNSIWLLFSYLKSYRKLVAQLFFALLISTVVQTIFPFITQAIVDVGINTRNIHFLHLILLAQLALFFGRTISDFIKRWIVLHIGARLNLVILSEFLAKMMRLPLSYFDSRLLGDTMQRIEDHTRIERFLTSSTLSIIFSGFTFIVFTAILASYSIYTFLVFILFSLVYVLYTFTFLSKRAVIDYKRFSRLAENQSDLFQLITSMPEIRLNNAEEIKRRDWESTQIKLFRLNISSLRLIQFQEGGGAFINEFKNILIIYITATAVMSGQISLGMMLSIQYIIGLLNAPILDFTAFLRDYQDANLSLGRIKDVQSIQTEEEMFYDGINPASVPAKADIVIQGLKFRYGGSRSPYVLSGLDLIIPHGKVTAIVGASGSGKTTLMKLILKFYKLNEGTISLNTTNIAHIDSKEWRSKCGVVMQDGVIFSDSVLNNVCIGDPDADVDRAITALRMANIYEFISDLPLGINTKIGNNGIGLSQGQRQRILIARAIYKEPRYLFFDEATSSLDANNEKAIVRNLDVFFKGKTVLIIAHRLSTVRNADQIIVLDRGVVTELGNHAMLVNQQGKYFELVKNQLELAK